MFFDDLKIFHSLSSDIDVRLVQQDINTVLQWCATFDATLNISKCAVLLFGRTTLQCCFSIDNVPLPVKSSMRDLGVYYDNRGKFDDHVTHVQRGVLYRIFLFKQKFMSRSPNVIRQYFVRRSFTPPLYIIDPTPKQCQ
eukprot:GHVN01081477.1.p3 GENE.GHVN01081477.1~~GHVN01081477.1.p3  ORF type:complete len:139 (+),score=11.63 GHVN01081477.1:896-1312(+)